MSDKQATRSAEAWNMRLIGHSDLNGYGDGMQLLLKNNYLFVGHLSKMGTSVLDVSDPTAPQVVHQIKQPPHVHSHKVQIGGDILIVNHEQYPKTGPKAERTGIQIFDISDPTAPREIGFFSTGGKGVHRLFYQGGNYVHMSAAPEGFTDQIMMIVDISDPTRPTEVSRWWIPGMWPAGGETPTWPDGLRYAAHHPNIWQDRAYWGFWDAGLVIMDISDLANPRKVSQLSWAPEHGGNTHTALPLPDRNLLLVVDESTKAECQESPRRVRVIDISDDTNPHIITMFPEPQGDFCQHGLRFGPHNLHENQPGAYQSDEIIFVTYFNAGLRVFDISDPTIPQEIAYYIPQTPAGQQAIQTNDVFVAENGLIYISDRVSGGVDILEMSI